MRLKEYKLSDEAIQYVIDIKKKNPKLTYKEISGIVVGLGLARAIGESTIGKILTSGSIEGYRECRRKSTQIMNERNRAQRDIKPEPEKEEPKPQAGERELDFSPLDRISAEPCDETRIFAHMEDLDGMSKAARMMIEAHRTTQALIVGMLEQNRKAYGEMNDYLRVMNDYLRVVMQEIMKVNNPGLIKVTDELTRTNEKLRAVESLSRDMLKLWKGENDMGNDVTHS